MDKIRVTIWYEYAQESGNLRRDLVNSKISEEDFRKMKEFTEQTSRKIHQNYPNGLLFPLRQTLGEDPSLEVTYTTLYDPDFGMPDSLLEKTD